MDDKQAELIIAIRDAAVTIHLRWGSITTQYCTIQRFDHPQLSITPVASGRRLHIDGTEVRWVDLWGRVLLEQPTAPELINIADLVRQHAHYMSSQDWLGRLDRSIASLKSLTMALRQEETE